MFRDNIQHMVRNRNVVILMGSITTGETLRKCMERLLYYGGTIQGVSAIFSAVNKVAGLDINAVFYKKDVPNYQTHKASECPMCKTGQKLDAIVNGMVILNCKGKNLKGKFRKLCLAVLVPLLLLAGCGQGNRQTSSPRKNF